MEIKQLHEFKCVREKTLCFSGSRDIPLYLAPKLDTLIYDIMLSLYNRGYKTFITGGAIGFDTIAAKAVINFKKHYPDIRTVMMIPYKGHDRRWKDDQRLLLENLIEETDEVIYIGKEYSQWIFLRRNDAMVLHSNHLVCFNPPDKTKGGTAYTIQKAKKEKLIISNIYIS